jgi:hypothetical protein
MSRIRTAILTYIDAYKAEAGLTDDGLGRRATGDNKVIVRLRAGENVGMAGIERIEDYIMQQRKAAKKAPLSTMTT